MDIYQEYLQNSIKTLKKPRIFDVKNLSQVITSFVLLLLIVIVFSWLVGEFATGLALFAFIGFFIVQFTGFLSWKRGRRITAWKNYVSDDGKVSFPEVTIEKAAEVIRTISRFRDYDEANEKYGVDVIDLLVLTGSYLQLPRNGGVVRIVKLKEK